MRQDDYGKLTSYLEQLISSEKTPGLQYVVLKDSEIVYEQSLGVAEFETGKKIKAETVFNAFSVTKTFTSLAVMQLARMGKIRLIDNVSNYLGEYPFLTDVKIYQLLSHTSGIPNPIPLRWIHLQEEYASFNSCKFTWNILNARSRPKHTPGESFSYSNLNYLILGKIIEKVTGTSYTSFVKRSIIRKIGVDERTASFAVSDDMDYARGYQKRFSLLNLLLGFFMDKRRYTEPSSNPGWIKFKKYYVNGVAYGGLITNAYALTKFMNELFKPYTSLLSDIWKTILLTPQQTNNGREINMTLGWFIGKLKGVEHFSHAGGGGGYYCEMRAYPEKNLFTAIIFNRSGIREEHFLDKLDSYFL